MNDAGPQAESHPVGSRWVSFVAAVAAPVILTAVLLAVNFNNPRDYVFLYLSIVAVLGVASGSAPAFVAAAVSFLAVDYLFVRPVHTLEIASADDVVNLVVFFGAAGLVGTLGSRRRAALLRSKALASELQTANLELARLNQEQAEAARLAAQLAESERHIRVLEETDKLRHELLANVSHELRTPLATILTGTTVMRDRPGLPGRLQEDLAGIAVEAQRLDRLVSDLLDMSRIEGGAVDLRLDDVDLRDAISAAVLRLQKQHPGRTVNAEIPADLPEVVADWDRLGQVLDNLLGNADRHGGSDGSIDVTAQVSGAMVEVRVTDHGPGVPAALRDRIFERFVRGEPGVAQSGAGTGLGLAIVRGLVEAQAGKVWLEEPRAGEGGRFAVSLPASVVDAE